MGGTSMERAQSGKAGRVPGPRCIALVGPFASGKTTLLEAILARTGAVTRQGTVGEKNTVGDASPEARAHQMSVEANIAETEFMGDRFTFVDCPGSIEFAFEADAVIAGVDLAVVVAEADAKKIPALQVILKSLEDRGVPHVLFLNKVDKADVGVRETLQTLQPASGVPLVLRHIPVLQNNTVTGFIDLALERAFVYREHAASEVVDISTDDKAREADARFHMLETLADYDDQLMEQLLGEIEPPRGRVFSDLAMEMREGTICPVLIGSAEHGHGVGRLLKAIRHEAPDIADTRARLKVAVGATAVQVLKTLHTTHGGKLSIARVLAGSVGDGAELLGPDGPAGRVSGVFRIFGQQAVKRDAAQAGETVGLGKLDGARTGMTLGAGKEAPAQVVTLTDGSYHSVDSSDMAFRTAAQIAMREGMPQCRPVLLEPVLKVEIAVPSEATPRVNGIVAQRRGQLLGFDARPGWKGWDVVEALIPQAEIRDLIIELRSASAGVGTFSARFDHLAELTGRLADQIVERARAHAA